MIRRDRISPSTTEFIVFVIAHISIHRQIMKKTKLTENDVKDHKGEAQKAWIFLRGINESTLDELESQRHLHNTESIQAVQGHGRTMGA